MRLVASLTPENLLEFLDNNRIWDYDAYDNPQKSPYMWCLVVDSDYHLQFARKYEDPPELRINPEGSRTPEEVRIVLSKNWMI